MPSSADIKNNLREALPYIVILVISVLILWIASRISKPDKESMPIGEVSPSEVLNMLQEQKKIASTEITIRKIGIYESETEFVSINPATWKLGTRMCVIPVDIKILYGIDLKEMKSSDIQLLDNDTILIALPKPKVIDKSFEPVSNHSEIVTLTTGKRKKVGESTIQQVKTLAFNDVVNNDLQLQETLSEEIVSNTKTVFSSLLRPLGLTPKFIDKH